MKADPLRLYDQGWRGLLPILPPDAEPARGLPPDKLEDFLRGRGKAPGRYAGGGRWALLANWRGYPDDEESIASWSAWPNVNVGLRACHQGSDVAFLDVDVTDPKAAGEITALIRRKIGPDAPFRIGNWPKVLFPVRVPGGIRKAKSAEVLIGDKRCMLEVLGEGQQAVVAGLHPGTRQPYSWPLGGLEDPRPGRPAGADGRRDRRTGGAGVGYPPAAWPGGRPQPRDAAAGRQQTTTARGAAGPQRGAGTRRRALRREPRLGLRRLGVVGLRAAGGVG
jgi:hypothetical protein